MYDYAILKNTVVFMKREGFNIFSISFAELREIKKENAKGLHSFLQEYGIDSQELFKRIKKAEEEYSTFEEMMS